ncbi:MULTISPECIES: response regulator transcription factor [Methylobacter]
MPIRIFLISNFGLLLQAIKALIESSPQRFLLAGSAEKYDQAAGELAVNTNIDMVLLDIDSVPEEVVPLVNTLRQVSQAKILLITRLSDLALQDKAIMAGARGIVDKGISPAMLLTAIEKVNQGEVWLSNVATGRIFVDLLRVGSNTSNEATVSKVSLLTGREQEIVAFIACNGGESGKAIANRLCISESTLRNHLTAIYQKLEVVNRHGLIAFAFQNGLAEPSIANTK